MGVYCSGLTTLLVGGMIECCCMIYFVFHRGLWRVFLNLMCLLLGWIHDCVQDVFWHCGVMRLPPVRRWYNYYGRLRWLQSGGVKVGGGSSDKRTRAGRTAVIAHCWATTSGEEKESNEMCCGCGNRKRKLYHCTPPSSITRKCWTEAIRRSRGDASGACGAEMEMEMQLELSSRLPSVM